MYLETLDFTSQKRFSSSSLGPTLEPQIRNGSPGPEACPKGPTPPKQQGNVRWAEDVKPDAPPLRPDLGQANDGPATS